MHRKKFLSLSSLGLLSISSNGNLPFQKTHQPMVLSTWDVGMEANKVAWEILSTGGNAIDAVEKGVMAIEDTINCCVGLGANPDREGFVTLDAAIMNHQYQCGSVAALERIKHPISVARKVMELTPHVMLTGMGAQQFALSQGFNLESEKLSPEAERSYKEWLKKSEYKPIINIENMGNHFPAPPTQ
ncbi:MAG: isoaspartyl peptidase/L-asparaginase, partial [Chitinophagaceae bacterium]